MFRYRLVLALALAALMVSPVLAESPQDTQSGPAPTDRGRSGRVKKMNASAACVPGARIEAFSEGEWYPAVVLDALRDGRCFVHYEGYGSDDDEAMAPKDIRPRR
jgi:hypothetical protein